MNGKSIALVGAALIIFGLFAPVVTMPIVGSISLFGNGSHLVPYLIAALAGLIGFAAFKNRSHAAKAPAIAALVLVGARFVEIQIIIVQMKERLAANAADGMFGGLIEQLSNTVKIEWGWVVLVAGAGAALYAAVTSESDAEAETSWEGKIRLAAIAIGLAGLASIAYQFISQQNETLDAGTEVPAEVAVTDILGAEDDTEETTDEEEAYIRYNVEVYDLTARYMDSMFDGRVPGVNFKVRNNGNRSLDRVEITVVFFDENGKAIAEDVFNPVIAGGYDADPPLRPGYIWQQERGQFYAAKSVPDEWAPGKASASVTDIEFSAAGE